MKKRKKKSSFTQKQLEKTDLLQQKSQSNVSLLAKIFNTDKKTDFQNKTTGPD